MNVLLAGFYKQQVYHMKFVIEMTSRKVENVAKMCRFMPFISVIAYDWNICQNIYNEAQNTFMQKRIIFCN